MAATRAQHMVETMRHRDEGAHKPKVGRQDEESTKMTKIAELSMPTSNSLAQLRRQPLMIVSLLWILTNLM